MVDRPRVRDGRLIDALESAQHVEFHGAVWRVVRADRDVLEGGAPGGRWDDGTFDVIYTSKAADGAVAEMYFHLSRGQPVVPSKMTFKLYEIQVALTQALKLVDLRSIAALGVETARYGALSCTERDLEYPRPQEIGETAHFIGFDGLIVPNARFDCLNAILFCDRVAPETMAIERDHGPIDWRSWRSQPLGY